MAKNIKLQNGLANLIGRADQEQPRAKEEQNLQEVTAEAEAPTPEAEEDVIDTIEDEELRAALEKRRNLKRGRPKRGVVVNNKQEEEFTRFCTLMKKEHVRKLKEISYRETLTQKEVLSAILEKAFAEYEETHGKIRARRRKPYVSAVDIFKKKS